MFYSTMKKIEQTAQAENFSAINVGKLSRLSDYVLELGPNVKIPGKVFGGRALQATGAEFSFQSLPRVRKRGSCIVIRRMRSFTFSFPERGSFRLMVRYFLFLREV